jgi:putative hydrolase of the HAD superfamily
MVRVLVLDFGGVLSEEGFRDGLKSIARKNGLNPEIFFIVARELIYETGYVSGRTDEHTYWEQLRLKTGVKNDDNELRENILNRFVLRTPMLEEIARNREEGVTVVLLSDQTNWLDELNQRQPFYHYFDFIFNSFHVRKNKRDPTLFDDVARQLAVAPAEILFVDDSAEHIERARSHGWKTLRFTTMEDFNIALKEEHI